MPTFAQPWFLGPALRRLRLASGGIVFAYVLSHLLDHALCNASWQAADAMLLAQKFVWQGVIGTGLLYGALLVHMALGLWALYARRQFRWTGWEALQLALGLAFPALLANHLAVTRTAWTLYGLDKGYAAELASLWVTAPRTGWLQIAVMLAAWGHGCLGLNFLLRLRRWYPAWQPLLLSAAVLVPVLALLGFVQGGREIARAMAEPGFAASHLPPAVVGTAAQKAHLAGLRDGFLCVYAAVILLVLLARVLRLVIEARRGLVVVSYTDGARVRVPRGMTVLDASRRGRVAHAAVCGGRGRCSTCRVRLVWAHSPILPAAGAESRLLGAIGADPGQIRLACQMRAMASMMVSPLIPPEGAMAYVAGRTTRVPGEERFVAAMFVDLRGSTRLAAERTPFDSVFLLGRFIAGVSATITASGGRPVQFLGDGVLALFGLDCDARTACIRALDAIAALPPRLEPTALLFRQELGRDLAYGVGLHCGQAIVGEVGFGADVAFTALGETVNLAHRLQEMARDHGATAVVSDAVFSAADLSVEDWGSREGKDFFFEKTKQKTFVSAVAEQTDKSFLVLFFKKGLLASSNVSSPPADTALL